MKIKLLIASFLTFAATAISQGATLYTNGTLGNTDGGTYFSDANASSYHASKFTISTDVSISSLIFDGFYITIGGSEDLFSIYIMENGTTPGSVVTSATNIASTRSLLSGRSYQYEVTFSSPLTLSAGTYWLSISSISDSSEWGWRTTPGSGVSSSSLSSPTTGYEPPITHLFTYQLNGNVVPEPSSLLLSSLGFAFLAHRKRALK